MSNNCPPNPYTPIASPYAALSPFTRLANPYSDQVYCPVPVLLQESGGFLLQEDGSFIEV